MKNRCVACRKNKWFTRVQTYRVPKNMLKNNPHLSQVDGMTSDGKLCPDCFNKIRLSTLGIPGWGIFGLRLRIKYYTLRVKNYLWTFLRKAN